MKTMKENNFLRQFRMYKEYLAEAKTNPVLKPYFCYDNKNKFFFATKFFTKETIINKFKNEIIK